MKTATGDACDRCASPVDFGPLRGLVTVSLEGGETVDRIFCYAGGCRDVALERMIRFPGGDVSTCSRCGASLNARAVALALLGIDLADNVQRSTAFCYANGCAAELLGRGHPTGGIL